MIGLLLASAHAASVGTATLEVGIHREAGTTYDIAVDGAAGQCNVTPSLVSCPATGPVTFRWGKGGPWELTGDAVVEPGGRGLGYVMAPDDDRLEERARLHPKWVNGGIVRELFVQTGDNRPPVPSRGMIDDLVGLAASEDVEVRRNVVDALVPFLRDTASDPFPPYAPEILPEGLLLQLAKDRDVVVKRRLGQLIREVQGPNRATEAGVALAILMADANASVRRVAIGVAAAASARGLLPAEATWEMAMDRVAQPIAGRAASGSLARLHEVLEPSETVDPREAVAATLLYHPEKCWVVWSAWREEVPFEPNWAVHLLRSTGGLNQRLLRYWAEHEPDGLAEIIEEWEPEEPHSGRFELAQTLLGGSNHGSLRRALDLPESIGPERLQEAEPLPEGESEPD